MNNKLNINNENIKCNILQKEYKKLSFILCKMQNIIIQHENILMYSKTQNMKLLNEIIKKLNEIYNKSIIEIFTNNKNK